MATVVTGPFTGCNVAEGGRRWLVADVADRCSAAAETSACGHRRSDLDTISDARGRLGRDHGAHRTAAADEAPLERLGKTEPHRLWELARIEGRLVYDVGTLL